MELDPETDLKIERILDVPREKIWACWTQPQHIPHFFIPKPHRITACEINLKTGGRFNTVFDIDGNQIENQGIFLEVVDGEKLVFGDTYTEGWKPAADPFMTAIILMEDAGVGKTKLTAIVRHRSAEIRQKHEDMGFYSGWNIMIDQLQDYAKTL